MRKINFFVEDAGHKEFLKALVQRLAKQYSILVEVKFVSARGGHGKVIHELKQHIHDLQDGKESLSDLFIVATDGNCKGYSGRKQEIDSVIKGFSGSIIYAIPDPHIERWLLLDSSAFKKVLGKGCSAPTQKCKRDLYKGLLADAVRDAGDKYNLSGIEYTEDLVNAMNLEYLERTEESLGKLLKALRNKFQEWERAEHQGPQELHESESPYILQTEQQPILTQTPLFDKQELQRLTVQQQHWEQTVVLPSLARIPERDNLITTSSIPINRLYTPQDNQTLNYSRDIGLPGTYPYTRGVQPTMYRAKPWTMRMFAGFGTAEDTNARFKYLLSQGQTGLSTAFDMPTLYGYDTDHPMAIGEFGKCGVAISSLADIEILFDGLPLDHITTSMTINSPAAVIWAMYIVNAEKRGYPIATLGGTLQNDILKEYTAQKEFLFPPEPSLRLVTDTIEFGTLYMPRWNTISISGYHIREAGATAIQELAFTIADGLAYVDAALQRGLHIDEFAPRLSFFFDIHNDIFEEIAKFRAARRLWAKLMRERYNAKDPRSWMMRCHAQTAGVSLTAQQPDNNIIRTTLQALAAVLGGTNSLHTNSLDEALALPTEKAVLIALRTQQIIASESGIVNTIDPLGGSYFIEALTDQTEQAALDYLQRIDALGGVLACIQNGFFQREIAESAYRYQQEIDQHKRTIVGVNDYTINEPIKVPTLYIDQIGEQAHLARLNHVRKQRDQTAVKHSLENLHRIAAGTENTMPAIIAAVKTYATLGEIMDVFRTVFGDYMEPAVF